MTPLELAKEMRSKIGKRSKRVGDGYELKVAKKISKYCGIDDWNQAFIRTRLSSARFVNNGGQKERVAGGQTVGDIMPIKTMADIWRTFPDTLGPLEMKFTNDWALSQMLVHPEKSTIFRYWKDSNLNCGVHNTVLFFSKPFSHDFVLYINAYGGTKPGFLFSAEGEVFCVSTLENFLLTVFPQFGPKD